MGYALLAVLLWLESVGAGVQLLSFQATYEIKADCTVGVRETLHYNISLTSPSDVIFSRVLEGVVDALYAVVAGDPPPREVLQNSSGADAMLTWSAEFAGGTTVWKCDISYDLANALSTTANNGRTTNVLAGKPPPRRGVGGPPGSSTVAVSFAEAAMAATASSAPAAERNGTVLHFADEFNFTVYFDDSCSPLVPTPPAEDDDKWDVPNLDFFVTIIVVVVFVFCACVCFAVATGKVMRNRSRKANKDKQRTPNKKIGSNVNPWLRRSLSKATLQSQDAASSDSPHMFAKLQLEMNLSHTAELKASAYAAELSSLDLRITEEAAVIAGERRSAADRRSARTAQREAVEMLARAHDAAEMAAARADAERARLGLNMARSLKQHRGAKMAAIRSSTAMDVAMKVGLRVVNSMLESAEMEAEERRHEADNAEQEHKEAEERLQRMLKDKTPLSEIMQRHHAAHVAAARVTARVTARNLQQATLWKTNAEVHYEFALGLKEACYADEEAEEHRLVAQLNEYLVQQAGADTDDEKADFAAKIADVATKLLAQVGVVAKAEANKLNYEEQFYKSECVRQRQAEEQAQEFAIKAAEECAAARAEVQSITAMADALRASSEDFTHQKAAEAEKKVREAALEYTAYEAAAIEWKMEADFRRTALEKAQRFQEAVSQLKILTTAQSLEKMNAISASLKLDAAAQGLPEGTAERAIADSVSQDREAVAKKRMTSWAEAEAAKIAFLRANAEQILLEAELAELRSERAQAEAEQHRYTEMERQREVIEIAAGRAQEDRLFREVIEGEQAEEVARFNKLVAVESRSKSKSDRSNSLGTDIEADGRNDELTEAELAPFNAERAARAAAATERRVRMEVHMVRRRRRDGARAADREENRQKRDAQRLKAGQDSRESEDRSRRAAEFALSKAALSPLDAHEQETCFVPHGTVVRLRHVNSGYSPKPLLLLRPPGHPDLAVLFLYDAWLEHRRCPLRIDRDSPRIVFSPCGPACAWGRSSRWLIAYAGNNHGRKTAWLKNWALREAEGCHLGIKDNTCIGNAGTKSLWEIDVVETVSEEELAEWEGTMIMLSKQESRTSGLSFAEPVSLSGFSPAASAQHSVFEDRGAFETSRFETQRAFEAPPTPIPTLPPLLGPSDDKAGAE